MSLYPKFRDVHLYVGLAIMIPVMIIAATGIGLNHEKALGLKKELPKKHAEEKHQKRADKRHDESRSENATQSLTSRASLLTDHASAFEGAMSAARETWGDVPLDHVQLKDEPGYGLVVKVKVPEHANLQPEEIIYSVASREVVARKGEKGEGYPLHKIIHDLHTGKIFSKGYGVLWSDFSGGAIVLLSLTGLVLYVIPLLKKRGKIKKGSVSKVDTAAIFAAARAKKPVAASEGA
jgi:hypothetical protein